MGRVINLDEIEPGAIVSEDVINPQGVVLLKKGLVLEEKHIKILRRWGISNLSVLDKDELEAESRPVEEIIQDNVERITNEMNERFKYCKQNELMMDIKQTIFDFRVQQIHKKYVEE